MYIYIYIYIDFQSIIDVTFASSVQSIADNNASKKINAEIHFFEFIMRQT